MLCRARSAVSPQDRLILNALVAAAAAARVLLVARGGFKMRSSC
jgi:hypothetical protein